LTALSRLDKLAASPIRRVAMRMKRYASLIASVAALAASWAAAQSNPLLEGYLCCNMRSDARGWISDINYEESHKHLVPAGTPAKMTGYGRNRFEFEVSAEGLPRKNYWLGNDYSRKLPPGDFAARYIVPEDPARKIAGFPPRIRDAIKAQKIATGMTREQVLMAIGHPISDETPDLSGPWKYWVWSFSPFTVTFKGDRVTKIDGNPDVLAKVVAK
jgi:hypothetical protein